MKVNIMNKLSILFATIVIAMMVNPSGKEANAQYCSYDHVLYWNNFSIINNVVLEDVTEGNIIIENLNSGFTNWSTVEMHGGPYEMNIGNDFELTVNWGTYYQGYLRVYLDRNDDQRFDYNEVGPDKEFVAHIFKTDEMWMIPPTDFIDSKIPIIIGDDVQEGNSVLRILTTYYEYHVEPCFLYYQEGYMYAYGEVEDYAIKFVAPLPEIYPTDGNILFNEEKYDGTTRNFKGVATDFPLPSVEFKGPQGAGNKIEYNIQGPLPSTEIVYTALEQGTGSTKITIPAGTVTFKMQSAIGSASVSTNEGTFLPSKGGEYRVVVKLTKPNGKVNQGAKVFTVANDFDMQISGIVSPRTNRFPRFFKYLVRTNIDVTTTVQNTGLAMVNKFKVIAKIYNAETNALVSTPPPVIYDVDNTPNLQPLAPGQKYEATFPAFNSSYTGEFYVTFEVQYLLDEEVYNNFFPRPDATVKHYFEVQYNDQLSAGNFENPLNGDTLKVNKPTDPRVIFFNNGISDASNVNFHMIVKDEAGLEVYNEVSFLEDLPQGRYNSRRVKFPNLVIGTPGTYTAYAWVDYPYDQKHDDDTTSVTFEVVLGNSGVITVGEANEGGIIGNASNTTDETQKVDMDELRIENSEFNFTGFSPNPATTSTLVTFETSKDLTLEVVDMNGNVIHSVNVSGSSHNLNTSNFASGTYTLVLRSENGVQTKQLSVVR